jgi:thymidylate synthase
LWQETDLRETPGLAPCAFLTIWNVRGGYLDMMMVQRSGDMLTASGPGGINEVQYAALLMMIARHTGYLPGVFTHVVANEQIYDRHIEVAEELLKRFNNYEMFLRDYNPCLILDEEKTNFYDMTIDDFVMLCYNPMKPQLSLELGI